jgi:hypothetical protein
MVGNRSAENIKINLAECQGKTKRWARGENVWWPEVEEQTDEKEMQKVRIDWEKGKVIRHRRRH